jgi:hypothetical protein
VTVANTDRLHAFARCGISVGEAAENARRFLVQHPQRQAGGVDRGERPTLVRAIDLLPNVPYDPIVDVWALRAMHIRWGVWGRRWGKHEAARYLEAEALRSIRPRFPCVRCGGSGGVNIPCGACGGKGRVPTTGCSLLAEPWSRRSV